METGLIWKREVLSNGLTVLQYPNNSAMTAQMSVAIKYGSNDDAKEKIGTAHFLEHMLVGGSHKRIRLNHQIELMGGCSGFETTHESTFTWVNIFSGKIVEASKIMAELILDEVFEKEKFDVEREIILNEIAEIADDPKNQTEQDLIKCLFPKHPVRNMISGTKKQVKERKLNDIEEAHRKHYIPSNLILILTGNYTVESINEILSFFQGKQNVFFKKSPRKIESSKPKKESLIKKSGVSKAYLCFGLRTPPAKNSDTLSLSLMNSILGFGESSRLFIELREKRALTYDFNSSNNSGIDFGYFSISCAVNPNLWKQTREIIKNELKKLATIPVPEWELQKSKNLILGDITRGIDDPEELPRIIADTELIHCNEKELLEYIKRIEKLTQKDILDTAKKYFREENYSTVILTPK